MVYLIVGLMLRIMIWVVKGLSFINKIGTFLSVLQYTIHVFRVIEKWLCINGVGVECHLFETITILRTALWFSHRMCSVRTTVVKYHYYNPKQIDQSITIQWMTWWCNTVSWTYCFKNTLRHVTTKFAHMNGHWKAYNYPSWHVSTASSSCGTGQTRCGGQLGHVHNEYSIVEARYA